MFSGHPNHITFCTNREDIYLLTWQVGKLSLEITESSAAEYLVGEMPRRAGSMYPNIPLSFSWCLESDLTNIKNAQLDKWRPLVLDKANAFGVREY